MSIFNEVYYRESQVCPGRFHVLSWKNRHDPITLVVLGGMAAGTTMSVMGTLQQGKDAQKITNQNAANLTQQAADAKKAADEKAKIQEEQGNQLKARQQSGFAAGNVKMNVGAPLVIAAQTEADIALDQGNTLMQGRQQRDYLLSEAGIQRKMGKNAMKNARNSAWATGLMGGASMAFMGYSGGMFGGGGGGFGKTTPMSNQGLNTSGTMFA